MLLYNDIIFYLLSINEVNLYHLQVRPGMTSSKSWPLPRSDLSYSQLSTRVLWVHTPFTSIVNLPRCLYRFNKQIFQMLEDQNQSLQADGILENIVRTIDIRVLRWRWTSRGKGACQPKGQEEACLWCITAPGCTLCSTATKGEWRKVRPRRCLSVLRLTVWKQATKNSYYHIYSSSLPKIEHYFHLFIIFIQYFTVSVNMILCISFMFLYI